MYIDTHAHLNYEDRYGDPDALVARLEGAGIGLVINTGWDLPSSRLAKEQADRYGILFFAAGVHPSDAGTFGADTPSALASLLGHAKGLAVGEIGLDYHYPGYDKTLQQDVFRVQISLADDLGLPFVVHTRDATEDTLRILRENRAKLSRGFVMHCFSGSPETAREYLRLGAYISFAGPVTFKNARRLDEVARIVPPDRILTETDSPYLAPEPLRGTQNTPLNVVKIYEKLAALRGVTVPELATQVHRNVLSLYGKLHETWKPIQPSPMN